MLPTLMSRLHDDEGRPLGLGVRTRVQTTNCFAGPMTRVVNELEKAGQHPVR